MAPIWTLNHRLLNSSDTKKTFVNRTPPPPHFVEAAVWDHKGQRRTAGATPSRAPALASASSARSIRPRLSSWSPDPEILKAQRLQVSLQSIHGAQSHDRATTSRSIHFKYTLSRWWQFRFPQVSEGSSPIWALCRSVKMDRFAQFLCLRGSFKSTPQNRKHE